MDLMQSINVSASGLRAQSARMKMHAENLANADSIISNKGTAYQRKQMLFEAEVNKQTGLTEVQAQVVADTKSPFKTVYDPSHPLADEKGLLYYPNVNTLQESTDMRQASRMYEANMQAIESAKEMMARSLDMLR